MLRRTFSALLALAPTACAVAHTTAARGFRERRAAHVTRLRRHGPAPGSWKPQVVPPDVTALRYPADGRTLQAWFAAPPGLTRCPALLYFHGEFSFTAWDFAQVRPFLAAGFCVMTPSLRGENGNPGDFELLRGELDDAIAALRWLAARPEVDPDRIYTLGHSVGGGLSALLVAVFGALNKRLVDKADPLVVTCVEMGTGALFLTVLTPWLPHEGALFPVPGLEDALLLLLLAIGCTLVPFVLSLIALRHLTAFGAQLVVNLEPVYAIVLAIPLLGEQHELGLSFYVGVAIILAAVFAHPLLERSVKTPATVE